MKIAVVAALLAGWLVAEPALAQVYVTPRRAGKTNVRYYEQDWMYADLLVGDTVQGAEAGGVRLYFYEQERDVAMRAASAITEAYGGLSEQFAYTPEKRFPYVLYSTYHEFLRTNLFPLQEGVLGVTSPTGLEVTLPYFGDHQQFEHVSTHELAHQFTIQKVASRASEAGTNRDPLGWVPLWFIEGLAEYYARGGLDPEAEMLVYDMVSNPEIYYFHGVPEFFDDFPGSGMWTYKAGQARVAYLEETYGQGTIQTILDESPWMVGEGTGRGAFRRLVEKVTGDDEEHISQGFDDWVKRRAFPQWLDSRQTAATFDELDGVDGYVNALVADPGDHLVMYRSIDRFTGRTRLFLADPRDHPRSRKRIAIDRTAGNDSLHPVDARNFDVRAATVVYVAESRGHDTLVVRSIEHLSQEGERLEHDEDPPITARIKLHDKTRVRLDDHDLVAVLSPSISPDGSQVAFIGLSLAGAKDIYVLTLGEDRRHPVLERITDDAFAERDLYWGPERLVYTSDATGHGNYNVFSVVPGQAPVRVTTEARDHRQPVVTSDGRILFLAWRDGGHSDLFEVTGEGVVARSQSATGLFDPSPTADGGLWALLHDEGMRHPAEVEIDALDGAEPTVQPPAHGEPVPRKTVSLDHALRYRAAHPANWQPGFIFGYIGAGAGAIFGEVYASATDRLRDHSMVLSVSMFGTPKLTDGYLVYMNQADRVAWGGGAFHALEFRFDKSLSDSGVEAFTSNERFYGALASVRYPFTRYAYVQLDQSVGAVDYFLFDDDERWLSDHGLLAEWESANDKTRLQTETTVRLGYDAITYHPTTGPLAGRSAMIEVTGGLQPLHDEAYGQVRLDAEQYFALPFLDGANLGLRGAAGASFGGRYARSFFLSSYDTLRGVRFGNSEWLIGEHFWFANAEVQVPLTFILRSAIASNLEGVVGVDFGAVDDDPADLWDDRVLDVALGGNVILGPLMLRLHWARAIDTGAVLPEPERPWVTNVSLTYVGF